MAYESYRDQLGKSRSYNRRSGNEEPFTTDITVGETELSAGSSRIGSGQNWANMGGMYPVGGIPGTPQWNWSGRTMRTTRRGL